MHLVHAVPSLDPAAGGPPAVACRLAGQQATLGHRVTLLTYATAEAGHAVGRASEGIPGFGQVEQIELPPPGRLQRAVATDVRAAVRQLVAREPITFLHAHGVWEPLVKAAADAAHAAGVPYAITPHGMLDPWSLSQKRLKKRFALALGYRRMLNRSAFLHTLNADEQRLMQPLGLWAPTEVVSNGIHLSEIDPLPGRGTFAAAHPQLYARPYLLFLSRLHYKKGLDHLADAFVRLADRWPKLDLVVAGPDDGARADLEQRVSAAGLTERVHVVGPLYGGDKYAALAGAEAFVLPSRQEGFSVAILEAMASRTPVVISDACHFPEVADAGAGLVVRLDAVAIAGGIDKLLTDPPAARKMGEAGRRLVEERYTWDRVAGQLLTAYERAAAHVGPPHTAGEPHGREPDV